jgi:hypothetical protein
VDIEGHHHALRNGDASLAVGIFAILLFGAGLFAAINMLRLKRSG